MLRHPFALTLVGYDPRVVVVMVVVVAVAVAVYFGIADRTQSQS